MLMSSCVSLHFHFFFGFRRTFTTANPQIQAAIKILAQLIVNKTVNWQEKMMKKESFADLSFFFSAEIFCFSLIYFFCFTAALSLTKREFQLMSHTLRDSVVTIVEYLAAKEPDCSLRN